MNIYGDVPRATCPVCNSDDIKGIWRIPFSPAQAVINSIKVTLAPTLSSDTIYCFSKCEICDSIFLDPYPSEYWDDHSNSYHADKGKERRDWNQYFTRVRSLMPHIRNWDTIVDVAAGGCQCLSIMREIYPQWKRMIMTDIRNPSIEYARKLGFEAYLQDACIPTSELQNIADCVIFAEAFEHVEYPCKALENISSMLRKDGCLYMTATTSDGDLPVRPAESIFTNEEALRGLIANVGLRATVMQLEAGRWRIIAHKE